jgi:hypothetical protein
MIKLRRVRWTGHVACMQVKKNVDRILMGKSERDNYEGQDMGGQIILKRFQRDRTDLAQDRE